MADVYFPDPHEWEAVLLRQLEEARKDPELIALKARLAKGDKKGGGLIPPSKGNVD